MGQAKNRGSFEQRRQEGIEREEREKRERASEKAKQDLADRLVRELKEKALPEPIRKERQAARKTGVARKLMLHALLAAASALGGEFR